MWYPPWLVTRLQFIIAEDQSLTGPYVYRPISPFTHWLFFLLYALIPYLKYRVDLPIPPCLSNPSSDAQAYIWVSRSVGYPPPIVCLQLQNKNANW